MRSNPAESEMALLLLTVPEPSSNPKWQFP
jgi:hypothetical protein